MNCIVVDDEPLAREKLKMMISADVTLNLLGCFGNSVTAKEFLSLNSVDLIFLDIEMSEQNGIDFARLLDPDVMVIFTTAYSQYALDSYEVKAIDYLLKPINQLRFLQAVQKAKDQSDLIRNNENQKKSFLERHQDYVFLKSERRMQKISFNDCLYVEAMKDYSIIHLENKQLIVSMNIKSIHQQLPPDLFVRISKSYVINFSKVISIDHHDVLIGTKMLMIGAAFRAYLFTHFVYKKTKK